MFLNKTNYPKIYYLFLYLTVAISISSCLAKKKLMPDDIAVSFLTAIYEKKDLNLALPHATQRLKNLISHYHSIEAIERNVIGYSTKDPFFAVKNIAIKDTTPMQAQIIVHSAGKNLNDEKSKEDIELFLVYHKNNWLVDRIKVDNYRTSTDSNILYSK